MGCPVGVPAKKVDNYSETKMFNESIPKLDESQKINNKDLVKQRKTSVTENYKMICKLGEGGFGAVFKVVDNKSNSIRAMKMIKKESIEMQDDDKKFLKEIEILMKLDHPNIVKVYEYYVDDIYYYLIMEYISGGMLHETIARWIVFSEKKAAIIMQQILSAVFYLHQNKIVHRDLKPDNILVQKTTSEEEVRIKLIDFGTCNYLEEGKYLNFCIGTPQFVAPEVLDKKYNNKCDVWSGGAILYMLLSGDPPFKGFCTYALLENVKEGDLNFDKYRFDIVSEEAKELCQQMLNTNFNKRPNSKECLNHKWIQSYHRDLTVKPVILKGVMKNIKSFNVKHKIQKTTIAFIVHFFEDTEEVEMLRKIFLSMDTSGDGRLNYKELREGFARVFGETFTDLEFNKTIEDIDQDADGYIGYQEFLRVTITQRQILRKKHLKLAFNHYDENGDGTLSVEELKEMLGTTDNIFLDQLMKEIDENNDGKVSFEEFCKLMRSILERNLKSKSVFGGQIVKGRISEIDMAQLFNNRISENLHIKKPLLEEVKEEEDS